jgi:hypothetical protein
MYVRIFRNRGIRRGAVGHRIAPVGLWALNIAWLRALGRAIEGSNQAVHDLRLQRRRPTRRGEQRAR